MKIVYGGITITQEDVDRWWATLSEAEKLHIMKWTKIYSILVYL